MTLLLQATACCLWPVEANVVFTFDCELFMAYTHLKGLNTITTFPGELDHSNPYL